MLILIFLIGFLLRVLMFLSQKSLWGDEWFSIELAQKSLSEVLASVAHDVHPPFFYAALHFLVQWFGFHEWVFRLIPFVSGVGTVIAVYYLARRVTINEKSALCAALLVAFSPYWLHLSNEIRSYGLLGFLSVLATLLLIRSTTGKRNHWNQLAYVLTASAVIYLEHYGWFWFFGVSAFSVYLYFFAKDKSVKNILWLQAAVLFMCLPAFAISAYQTVHTEPVLYASRLSPYHSFGALAKKLIGVFWHFACGPTFAMLSPERMHGMFRLPSFWYSLILTVLLFMMSLKSFFGMLRTRREYFILILFLLFFPIACLLILYPIRLHSRYLTFAAPYFFILIGDAFGRGWPKKWAMIFILIVSGTYLWTDYQFIRMKTDPVHKEDYPAMVRATFERAKPGDVICGFSISSEMVPYYERRLNILRPTEYVNVCSELAGRPGLAQYNRIWLMGYIDMDEKVNVRNISDFTGRFAVAGFTRATQVERFGGENGLNALYLFEKK